MTMAESILRDRSKEFAKQIVFLCRDIKANMKESVLTTQLLRSGTSIGANIHEAQYAQGTKDFISKLEIAQKECYETEHWMELLFETGYILENVCKPLQNQCAQIPNLQLFFRRKYAIMISIICKNMRFIWIFNSTVNFRFQCTRT